MQCSGKYGILTKVDDHSTEKTGASVDQSTYIKCHAVGIVCILKLYVPIYLYK